MALTDTAVRNAKAGSKQKKLYDERGLFLLISPKGGKWWRFRYQYGKKEKLISLGVYPDISLKEARERRDECRKMVAKGIDPGEARKKQKVEAQEQSITFETVAREWLEKKSSTLTPAYAKDVTSRLERDVFPFLGERPIKEITAPEVLTVVQRIEARGVLESARRALQKIGQIFRYAIASGLAERDLSADLRGALTPQKKRHYASLTDPKAVAGLLRAIDEYEGQFITKCALHFGALTFVRPGELRHAEWKEIDLESSEWRIPAEKMKMKAQHIVPLSKQAISVLEEIQPVTGDGKYVFPSLRSKDRPMSENTVNAALRRMGYSREEMTGHGFRSMASTLLNELGWNRDAIERQLAHAERNKVRAAYNYADYLKERRKMMQAWADYLETLKESGKVIPLRREMA